MPKHIDFAKQPVAVALAAHAIGLDNKNPYTRRGKRYYRPYRNYYTAPAREARQLIWQEYLLPKGYARLEHRREINGQLCCRYALTPEGLAWLGDKLGITILPYEED